MPILLVMLKTNIQLSSKQVDLIKSVLQKNFGNADFWIYGSRVKGNAKKFSDVDIIIKGRKIFTIFDIGRAKTDLAESDLPYLVDIIDWHSVTEGFLETIKPDLVKI